MRLRVAHSIVRHFDPPAPAVTQLLRLTPRNHEGQHVIGWRIDVSIDARLNAHQDAFGNITHFLSAAEPLETLRIGVVGEVETHNGDGVVRGTVERFSPSLFLRDTLLTQADQRIGDFARDIREAKKGDVLAELHSLLDRLHQEMRRRGRDVANRSCDRRRSVSAKARRSARPGAHFHRRRPQSFDPGTFCRRLFVH
jgi:transglutaminase-like putative cysteine protease